MADTKDFDSLPPILTPKEAADLLRMDVSSVKAWAREGKLAGAFKLGPKGVWRVRTSELVAYIMGQRKDGTK
jgi:predicted site-specific integrase-resolvase